MTEAQDASPKKKTIYRPTTNPGVRSIWDWNESRQSYVQRKQGRRYQAYLEKDGKTYSGSFRSVEEAIEWRQRIRFDLEKSPVRQFMNFKELLKQFFEFKEGRVQVSTLESYRGLSRHFEWFGVRMVEDINSHTIDDWLTFLKTPAYRSALRSVRVSFAHEVSLLRIVFSYYKEYFNESYENPVRKRHNVDCVLDLKKKKEKEARRRNHFLPPEDIDKFLRIFQAQAAAKPKRQLYATMALIQGRTGLRIGEVVALDWRNIDWSTGFLDVTKTVQWMRSKDRRTCISGIPKNGRFRRVKFSEEVLQSLRLLREQQERRDGLIFSHDGKTLLPYRSIQHHYNGAFREAGLEWQSTHILRHSFATHFLQVTHNALALKEILGHSELRMTERYGKVTEEVTRAATEQFERAIVQGKVIPFPDRTFVAG